MFDILIRHGTVVDGTGRKPGYVADVGLKGERIFDMGDMRRAKGKVEIDAKGLVVSPGFIDVQNHADSYGGLLHDPRLESLIYQGITTILIGQCGSSLAPLLKGSLASIQKWTDIEGVNINWRSMGEFLEEMSRRRVGVNLATFVGHATLRRDFVGDATRPLTLKEEKQLVLLLRRSLHEGARGFSVGLAYSHERLATQEEIANLLKVVYNEGGLVSLHLRNEGPEIFSALNEALGLLRTVPARAKISHLKVLGAHHTAMAEQMLRMMEVASRDGVPIYFDVYPYTASAIVLYLLLPEWATLGGRDQLIKRIKTKSTRQDVIRDIESQSYPYEKIIVAATSLGQTFVGRSVAQIAASQGISGAEAILNLIVASRDQLVVFWHDLDSDVVSAFLRHPLAIIATDGSGYSQSDRFRNFAVHPRSFGATARVLGEYVREKKVLTLEEAVHKMTGFPARWLGLSERGIVAKNSYADLVIFNPHTVADIASYENPFRHPRGIEYVLINGELVLKKGVYWGELAGRVLRKLS